MYCSMIRLLVVSLLFCLTGCETTSGPGSASQNNGFLAFTPPQPQASLAQSVQDALVRSGDPVIAQVRVQENQSQVILTGYVKKIRQSDMAEQLARRVPGVKSVENHLIVRQ